MHWKNRKNKCSLKEASLMILPFFVVFLLAPGGYTAIALIVEFRVN